MLPFLLAYLIAAFLFAFLGEYVATQTGRSKAEGFFLGFLYGPLGVLVAALLPRAPARSGAQQRVSSPSSRRAPGDPAEAEVSGFLASAGGQPTGAIDLEAIADAVSRPAAQRDEEPVIDFRRVPAKRKGS